MYIEIFHDTACPWCRIGKRHLALALQDWQGEPLTVQYRTFFLNESIPAEGYEFRSYMHAKGGGQVALETFFDGPRRAGAAVGVVFNFERIAFAPNTLLSHQLIALTPADQKETIIDALYAAYFEHGQDIGNIDTLVTLAKANGLDEASMRAQLLSNTMRNQVIQEARRAQQIGVTGVPFFLFNSRYGISGAQPPQTLRQIMEYVVEQDAHLLGDPVQ